MTPTPDPTPTAPASAERMVLVSESVLRAAGWRTLREWHEEAAGYGLAEFFFRMTGINPDEWGPPALAQPQPAAAAVADGLRALALDWRTEAHHTDDHQDEAWTAINNTLRRCADDVLALLATPAPQPAQAPAGTGET